MAVHCLTEHSNLPLLFLAILCLTSHTRSDACGSCGDGEGYDDGVGYHDVCCCDDGEGCDDGCLRDDGLRGDDDAHQDLVVGRVAVMDVVTA
jgi:hypothetical protein